MSCKVTSHGPTANPSPAAGVRVRFAHAHVCAERVLLELKHLAHRQAQAFGVKLRVGHFRIEHRHKRCQLLAECI